MQVRTKTSTELMLGAMDERKGWDPTVSTTMDQPISLTGVIDRNYIQITATALGQGTYRERHIRIHSWPLNRSSIG